jgi:hypothetical protein
VQKAFHPAGGGADSQERLVGAFPGLLMAASLEGEGEVGEKRRGVFLG